MTDKNGTAMADAKHKHRALDKIGFDQAKEQAKILYLAGVRSMTELAKRCNINRETVRLWKLKGKWDDLNAELETTLQGKALKGLADYKAEMIAELQNDIALIDNLKRTKGVKAKSLEGILKVKLDIIDRILLMRGDATARTEQVVVRWDDRTEGARVSPQVSDEIRTDLPAANNTSTSSGSMVSSLLLEGLRRAKAHTDKQTSRAEAVVSSSPQTNTEAG